MGSDQLKVLPGGSIILFPWSRKETVSWWGLGELAWFLSKYSSYTDGTLTQYWYVLLIKCVFCQGLFKFINMIIVYIIISLQFNICLWLVCAADMSSTAFIEPLPVIDFVTQLLNRDVSSRPLSDSDRIKVRIIHCLALNYLFSYKQVQCYFIQFL
jgi:hypothetical protein